MASDVFYMLYNLNQDLLDTVSSLRYSRLSVYGYTAFAKKCVVFWFYWMGYVMIAKIMWYLLSFEA